MHQEREALKKLDNVRKDHNQRLRALEETQEVDKQRAELITRNQELVDSAILAIRSAVANQVYIFYYYIHIYTKRIKDRDIYQNFLVSCQLCLFYSDLEFVHVYSHFLSIH